MSQWRPWFLYDGEAINRRGFLRLSAATLAAPPPPPPPPPRPAAPSVPSSFFYAVPSTASMLSSPMASGILREPANNCNWAPGTDQGALPLDSHFGLHPALAGLLPLWNDKKLAFVHAAGSPDATRSHFDAQLYIENGTPGRGTTRDGWMNRLLAVLPEPRAPTAAVSIGPTLSQILKGPTGRQSTPRPQRAEADADRPAGDQSRL